MQEKIIIGLFPLEGNGGIQSWTKKFLKTFPSDEFRFIPVNNAPLERKGKSSLYIRIKTGLLALKRVLRETKKAIKDYKPEILHTTTSGDIGSLRDLLVGRLCKKYGVKSIMHCRYGCISEYVKSKGFIGQLTRKAMKQFDQIWVLDSRSYNTLREFPVLKNKVFLTPNSIEVSQPFDDRPKSYKRVAFIGNLHPTKGFFELIEAVKKIDGRVDIIGPGPISVIEELKQKAGKLLDHKIFIHGRLSNEEAVKYMEQVDIVALPTYYAKEAFPMSILEAMSLSKIVIACPRAAIQDMLTDLDGNPCGLFVTEKSSDDIKNAIEWCQENPVKADKMRKKAYEKVSEKYRMDKVYEIYRKNYLELLG